MEKLKTLIKYLRKKFERKKENADSESEEEIGSFSMNEGKPDKVFGFRREVVKGVGIFFITVFSLALIFASSGKGDEEEKIETLPIATESEIASAKKPKNELPNDYETLVAMNKAREEELRRQAEAAGKNEEKPKQETVPVVQENPVNPVNPVNTQVIPEIPQNRVQSEPVESQIERQMPEIHSTVEREENVPIQSPQTLKEMDGKYKSAISFNIVDDSNQNEEEVTKNLTHQNHIEQTRTEYYEPDNSTLGVGTVIPVRLLTGINTDVEGQVMAQILTDVYDTATGTKLLIPQGSRLMGTYEKKSVTNGRVPVTFTKLVMPNGGCWTISENLIAIDGAGYTGIVGKVHHHTGEKISAGAIGSAIAALGSVAAGNVSTNNNTYTAGQIATQGAVANLINSTSGLMRDAASIPNTVTVEPGYEFNVYVTNNIKFG